jgi:hypothetical protein
MSRRSTKKDNARASPVADASEDEFVLVTPKGSPAAGEAAPPERIKGTPEEEEAYERAMDVAYRADLLGVEHAPVCPPGHVLVQTEEKPGQITFWHALFRSEKGAQIHFSATASGSVNSPILCSLCLI